MRDHETIEGLLAAQALGGLDDDDARMLATLRAEHGPDCKECAALERDFAEMAARFAMELDPAPLREGFEEQVMAAARSADRDVAAPPVPVPDAAAPSSWGRRIAVLAVAAALVLGAIAVGYETIGGGPFDRYVDSATQISLEGDAPGQMTIAYKPGEAGGAVVASGIPDAAGDDVYAVWTITGDTPSLIGCFTPDDGQIEERFDSKVDGTDLVAVTVEPAACPAAPTTDPIMSAPVPPS
jgi:anti-sigma-K factor RskA